MTDNVVVRTNLPAFKAQLRAIGADFEQKAVRSATAGAAAVFRALAKKNAPVLKQARNGRTAGTLQRNIIIKRSRNRTRGKEEYLVTVRSGKKASRTGDPFYWRFLEAGWIPRGRGKRLQGGKRRRALERRRLADAGARKVRYPFLAPAFRQGGDKAVDVFFKRLSKQIDKYNQLKTSQSTR